MNYKFEDVAKIYLPELAKPLEIHSYKYRGCNNWVFKRKVRKWAPKDFSVVDKIRKKEEIKEEDKRYYIKEYWMGISDYFLNYDAQFEDDPSKTTESPTREEAILRLNYFIDMDYHKIIDMMDIE